VKRDPTLEQPFPDDFDPVASLFAYVKPVAAFRAYLLEHEPFRLVATVIGVLLVSIAARAPSKSFSRDRMAEFLETLPVDDERLSEAERVALDEPYDRESLITLEEFRARRAS